MDIVQQQIVSARTAAAVPIPTETRILRPALAREAAYAEIRDWIVNGVLEPGERLNYDELAERLGVSRTPVREALLRLEDEGLVESASNRWTRVSSIDMREGHDLFAIIWTLEALALRQAAERGGTVDLEAVEAADERLHRALAAGQLHDAIGADYELHGLLVAASGNARLTSLVAGPKVALRRITLAHFKGLRETNRPLLGHADVIASLRAGDLAQTALVVEHHWRSTAEAFQSLGHLPGADAWYGPQR